MSTRFYFVPFIVIVLNLYYLFSICQVAMFILDRKIYQIHNHTFCDKIVKNAFESLGEVYSSSYAEINTWKGYHYEKARSDCALFFHIS